MSFASKYRGLSFTAKPDGLSDKSWKNVCELAAVLMLESGGDLPWRSAMSEAHRLSARRASA